IMLSNEGFEHFGFDAGVFRRSSDGRIAGFRIGCGPRLVRPGFGLRWKFACKRERVGLLFARQALRTRQPRLPNLALDILPASMTFEPRFAQARSFITLITLGGAHARLTLKRGLFRRERAHHMRREIRLVAEMPPAAHHR